MRKSLCIALAISTVFWMGCSNDSDNATDDTIMITDDTANLTGDPKVDFPANFQATGSSGADILANTSFDRLEVEIAFVDGFRPTQEAMDNFDAFLRELTFKESIDIVYSTLDSPNEETLTLQEVADLEIENRTAYNDGSTLAIYIYFADAPSDEDDPDEDLFTLGAVYRNTSMIIYEKVIRDLAAQSPLISRADIETATLNHEFGHLFGLVNLGTDAVNEHEDTEAENHCNVDGCLMRAQLQFSAAKGLQKSLYNSCVLSSKEFMNTLESRAAKGIAAPPDLDNECRIDLESVGGRTTSASAKGY